jgi:hypothetical protein
MHSFEISGSFSSACLQLAQPLALLNLGSGLQQLHLDLAGLPAAHSGTQAPARMFCQVQSYLHEMHMH